MLPQTPFILHYLTKLLYTTLYTIIRAFMPVMTIELCIKISENKRNARQCHLGYLHTEADSHFPQFSKLGFTTKTQNEIA